MKRRIFMAILLIIVGLWINVPLLLNAITRPHTFEWVLPADIIAIGIGVLMIFVGYKILAMKPKQKSEVSVRQ